MKISVGEVGAPARRCRLGPGGCADDGAANAGVVEMRDGRDRVEGADALAVEQVEIRLVGLAVELVLGELRKAGNRFE